VSETLEKGTRRHMGEVDKVVEKRDED